MLTDKVQNTAL